MGRLTKTTNSAPLVQDWGRGTGAGNAANITESIARTRAESSTHVRAPGFVRHHDPCAICHELLDPLHQRLQARPVTLCETWLAIPCHQVTEVGRHRGCHRMKQWRGTGRKG